MLPSAGTAADLQLSRVWLEQLLGREIVATAGRGDVSYLLLSEYSASPPHGIKGRVTMLEKMLSFGRDGKAEVRATCSYP